MTITVTTLTRGRSTGHTLLTLANGDTFVTAKSSDLGETYYDVERGTVTGNASVSKSVEGLFSYNDLVSLLGA